MLHGYINVAMCRQKKSLHLLSHMYSSYQCDHGYALWNEDPGNLLDGYVLWFE